MDVRIFTASMAISKIIYYIAPDLKQEFESRNNY